MFEHAVFIKTPAPFDPGDLNAASAPLFRAVFTAPKAEKAVLAVCALGYGEFYLNGTKVTEDKFVAPVSDYEKTLWYTTYDVTGLLRPGKNVFAAVLGHGFFNEVFPSSWDYDKAPWRDAPKLLAELTADGAPVMATGEGWVCRSDSAIVYSQLRSGEHFDARRRTPGWERPDFDDSGWEKAVIDPRPPKGALRECLCPPVRECAVYPAVSARRTGEGRWLFDIGQNISGYVRLHVREPEGTELVIRYAEEADSDGSLLINEMDSHYKRSAFMTDRYISDGREDTWSPRFVYHGFRYVEIAGFAGEPLGDAVTGVFVHQDVAPLSGFACSDERLTRLFEIGQTATLSNLMYMPTDCPTREKLGWCNDAQASCEQMLLNFDTASLFRKWLRDIFDAMREDGAMPGIVPTSGWGFTWGNGPVSDGILFEVPARLYEFTGDAGPLIEALPYFRRYLDYLETRRGEDGLISFGLDDWAPPTPDLRSKTPAWFINEVFRVKFLRIAARAEALAGEKGGFAEAADEAARAFRRRFIGDDGRCRVDSMTAAAMVIVHGLYTDLGAVRDQLLEHIAAAGGHHECGMVGMPHLLYALDLCGRSDLALGVLTAEGMPGYMAWLEGGATTLWEMWRGTNSHNHHMYSSFMAWLVKTVGGLRPGRDEAGGWTVRVHPVFVEGLEWAEAWRDTPLGRLFVRWERRGDGVKVDVRVPRGVRVVD